MLDGPEPVRALDLAQVQGVVPVRLHRVRRDQGVLQGQRFQERLEVADLVRLPGFGDPVPGDHDPGAWVTAASRCTFLFWPYFAPLRSFPSTATPCRAGTCRDLRTRRDPATGRPGAAGTSRRPVPPGSSPPPAASASVSSAFLPAHAAVPRGARHTRPGPPDPARAPPRPLSARPRTRRDRAVSAACPASTPTARPASPSAGWSSSHAPPAPPDPSPPPPAQWAAARTAPPPRPRPPPTPATAADAASPAACAYRSAAPPAPP